MKTGSCLRVVEGLQFINIENGQLVMLHRIFRKFMFTPVKWNDPKFHKAQSQSSLYQLLHSSECVHTYICVNVRDSVYMSVCVSVRVCDCVSEGMYICAYP